MANEILINNLRTQMERLVNQTMDLSEYKDDLDEDEYNSMKLETVEQIKDFGDTLDRLISGDVSLNGEVSTMKWSLRNQISSVYNTAEMIKIFGEQEKHELNRQLLKLYEDFKLKKITKTEFENDKIKILGTLKEQGYPIAESDQVFLDNIRSKLSEHLEQINDD